MEGYKLMTDKYNKLIQLLEQVNPAVYKRWASAPVASVAGQLKNKPYGETEKKGPMGKTYAKPKGIPTGMMMRRMYNSILTSCLTQKNGVKKNAQCRVAAATKVLQKAKMDLNSTSMIENKKEQSRLREKIAKQMNYYQNMRTNSIQQLQSMSNVNNSQGQNNATRPNNSSV